jgi:hypothetical protein
MKDKDRVVVLIGSPKGLERSASARLATSITTGLESEGWECEAFHLHAAVRDESRMSELLTELDRSNLVILSFPLYVDSFPAPVIHALDRIATHRKTADRDNVPRFFSIINCGFVEPWQNETAQQMLRQFCDQACLEWIGKISLGGGGTMNRSIRRAFRLVTEALHEEIVIPEEVYRLTRYRVMPAWLYVLGGNFMWRRIAKKNGARARLKAQPYRRDSVASS